MHGIWRADLLLLLLQTDRGVLTSCLDAPRLFPFLTDSGSTCHCEARGARWRASCGLDFLFAYAQPGPGCGPSHRSLDLHVLGMEVPTRHGI